MRVAFASDCSRREVSCQMVRRESAPAERRVDSSDECASAQICKEKGKIKKRLVKWYVVSESRRQLSPCLRDYPTSLHILLP